MTVRFEIEWKAYVNGEEIRPEVSGFILKRKRTRTKILKRHNDK